MSTMGGNERVKKKEVKRCTANISETTVPLQFVDEASSNTKASSGAGFDLRGLARGKVDPRLHQKRPCIVFGDSYPSWLAFAPQLGYEPALVVLRSPEFLSAVEDSVSDHCVIVCSPDWTCFTECPPAHFRGREAVSFVDGRVTQEVLDLSQICQVPILLGTALARRSVKGWSQRVAKADHFESGGVTHSLSHVVACVLNGTHPTQIPTPTLPTHIPRDLGSVLSDVVGGGFSRPMPKRRQLAAGAVVTVRRTATNAPVYHGHGWLPAMPSRKTWVLTPSVYAKTSEWKLRRMTDGEFLAVYDYPDRLVPVLSPLLRRATFPNLRPGKALLAAACGALRLLVGNGGGDHVSVSAVSADHPRPQTLDLGQDRPAKVPRLSPQKPDPETKPFDETLQELDRVEKELEETLNKVDRELRERKATKSDDAEVPVYLWTEHYMEESHPDFSWTEKDKPRIEKAMNVIRKLALQYWKKKLLRSYLEWAAQVWPRSEGPSASRWVRLEKDSNSIRYQWEPGGLANYQEWRRQRCLSDPHEFEAGSDAVSRALNSSWWEWDDGSRPFHWRWPAWYRQTIRDGLKVHLRGKSPTYRSPQKDEKNPQIKEAIKKKLSKVRARRYISKGTVVSLTSFFAVEKGEDDIRMVYDGTKSGLNEAMWVPRFGLPTIETHLRSIEEGTFLADVDVGECFLNFPLHPSLRQLAGVDFTHYFPDPSGAAVWECWHRALMGVKSSPYQAVQGMTVAEEVIRGNPSDSKNVFKWDSVRLNLPGDEAYDPSKPWVSKVRNDGQIAADLVGYVDDLRPSGSSRKEAWHAARRTASILNHLGIQDAARKRRDSSRTPGAWAGSVVITREDGVYVTVDTEKWKKAKAMVAEISSEIEKNSAKLKRKRLEVIRGFLNYVVRTYPSLKPYLTGLHLTIDGWRHNRDKNGWRIKDSSQKVKTATPDEWNWDEGNQDEKWLKPIEDLNAPVLVEAKKRLGEDMEALGYLMSSDKPLPRRVRNKAGKKVIYCFGDASSSGFGITLEVDGIVYYEYGQWNEKAEKRSSNWREATNLLEGLRRAIKAHRLQGLELFIFTDNTTAESTFWKGSSRDEALSYVVLEMRKLEMEFDLLLHVVHVSGSRMIRQGTDGLSRADHSNGVMNGDKMTRHVPLNLSALERSPILLQRLKTCFSDMSWDVLEPRDWFDEHHRFGNFVWAPPPAAADAVVDLLNKARHKRPESMHIVLIPRLMTGRWRRMMTRTADFYFKIDWGDAWNLKVHHEPLLCFILLPFSVSMPNLSERNRLLDDMDRLLLQSSLQQKSDRQKWDLLRKLFARSRSLCPLPKRVL
mmetsp:Transcript_18229/g.45121  ORF Transcript_18229/g.45121 Transcript_18229/m.45121 type:complete len:1319 (-) Transcript_18229:2184-6140(-)